MSEQTPGKNPAPEHFDISQMEQPHDRIEEEAEEISEEPEASTDLSDAQEVQVDPGHFLAPILGKLSVYQAGVLLMRYRPDGRVAMPHTDIARHYGVTPNAISQTVRRVWRDFPESEPERTPKNEYVAQTQRLRDPVQRDRPERYRLGEVEVSLSTDELAVMSRRYNSQGKVIAKQKDVAEELGISLRTLSRIEHRVLDDFPEIADIIKGPEARSRETREPLTRTRSKNYTLGGVEVMLSEAEYLVMSTRFNAHGEVVAEQDEIAQQLGRSRSTVSRIESKVLNDYPELTAIIRRHKRAENVERGKPVKEPERKQREAKPKPVRTKEPKPSEPPSESMYDPEPFTSGIDFRKLYDVSKPTDDEK
jgi:DNA-directed RNA polymerase specialized sigma subunit